MPKAFSIVAGAACPEVVLALETMMEEAGRGELVGIAVALLYTGFRYDTAVIGEAGEIPTFTHGAVGVLADDLLVLIRKKRASPPNA